MKRITIENINTVSELLASSYLKSAKVSLIFAAAATAVYAASTYVLARKDEDEYEEEYYEDEE